jgi:hypothetical protein
MMMMRIAKKFVKVRASERIGQHQIELRQQVGPRAR